MQVEEMRDFFSQKTTFEEIRAIPQTRHPWIRGYLSSQSNLFPKKGISSKISQDHMQAMISEAVADDGQRIMFKIYFFE